MIKPPAFSRGHPDRTLDCEMSVEEEFCALTDRIRAAGWTEDEAAAALLSLALNYVKFRKEVAAVEPLFVRARKRKGY